jgi:hypothetical protein
MQCKHLDIFAFKVVNIWHGPGGTGHRFAENTSLVAGNVLLQKSVAVCGGSLFVAQNVGACAHIVAKGYLGHAKPPFVGSSAEWDPSASFASFAGAWAMHAAAGRQAWDGELQARWYAQEVLLGNGALHRDIGFSFRDPAGIPIQYRAINYSYPETWWQQLIRTGRATGGKAWVENPVVYQSSQTYPFPGRDNWLTKPTYVCYQGNTMFDAAQGRCLPRSDSQYKNPSLGSLDHLTMQGNFKTIM